MIILSADGVIVFVAGNITSLLGHLPDEVMGKNLLSLLPDHEKRKVYQKIAFKQSLSSSVGKHIDFCCHIKRGNDKHDGNPAYEYVKFILTLKDISIEPLVLFSSFFPSPSFAASCDTYLPLEDQFYLVGSICILKTQTLQDLFTIENAGEDIQLTKDSDGEHLSTECRSVQGQIRSSRMESLFAEPAATASDDQVDPVTVDWYGPQEYVPESDIVSTTCSDSSTSSMESILELPATSSLQSFEFEPEVEQVDDMGEVQQVDELEEVEQVDEEEEVERVEEVVEEEELEQVYEVEEEYQLEQEEQEDQLNHVEQEDQLGQVEQEALSSSNVTSGINDELLQPPLSIALYINKRELQLMRKFREQLEEKTQMMQADIKNLQDTLEMMKEQLWRIQDSSFQPTKAQHIDCPEPQSLDPVPKKRRTERMEGPLPDFKETNLSCGSRSSHYFKFPEELEEPCDASNQGQEQHMQQQILWDQQMQEQPQQHNAIVRNQMLQRSLPNQAGMAVPFQNDPTTFMKNQPIVASVQLIAGQQPSDCYQEENLGDHEDDRGASYRRRNPAVSRFRGFPGL
ncbi:circadian clock protein PASD1 [Suricata suricatta]|uniref:circadian clock protein PASD1 n=1 Tax=Suricata suricatta TaxID=37032 RepID=UPI0011559F6D|nr:circadian clock protein PASD1 [Suricata suricatta]